MRGSCKLKSKWLRRAGVFALSCLMVAGCSAGPAKEAEKAAETPSSIKVMFYDENYFFQAYGNMFISKYPNIDIEVVNMQGIFQEGKDYNKSLKEFIEKEKPDVVMVNKEIIGELAEEGKLVELDPLIERDKYSLDSYFPSVLDLLKEEGNGKLYGLAPTFSSNVIYYNADLFAEHGVDVPKDGMTWQELVDTAKRFPTTGDEKTRIYGFGMQYGGNTLEQLASMMGSAQGLQIINTDTMTLSVNTDSWKEVYQMALDVWNSGTVYKSKPENNNEMRTMEDYFAGQPFIMGKAAMTIDGTYMIQNLKQAKSAMKDYKPFQVGIAAGPVDPANPDKTYSSYISDVFGIHSSSSNPDAAWEFVKYVNSEEFAKIQSRTLNNGMPTRMGIVSDVDGLSMETFYKLQPASVPSVNDSKIPMDFYGKFQPILSKELKQIEDKKKSIDEALNSIQQEGQEALDKAVKEQEAKKAVDTEEKETKQ